MHRPQIQFHTVIVFFWKDLPTVGTISQGESFRLYSHHRGFQTNEGALESSQRMNFWTGDWWKFGKECHCQDDILRLLATSEGDVLEDDTLVDKAEDTFWTCVCVCASMLVTLTVRGSHFPI